MKRTRTDDNVRTFYKRPEKNDAALKAVKVVLTVLGVAAFWLGLWMILSLRVDSELLLPSPVSVFKRLFRLSGTAELWKATGQTLGRILLGYLGGILAGTVLAALTAWSSWISAVAAPVGRIAKATPVASFIILALVWLPAGNIPSFIVFLLVTPIVWDALKTALLSVDKDLLEMAKIYRLGAFRTVAHVYFPSALPAYLSSVITSLGLAWKSGIAAEVLCLPRISIGRLLYESKIYLEMTDLFAWTTLVVILSVIMEAAIRLAVKRFVKSAAPAQGGKTAEAARDNESSASDGEAAATAGPDGSGDAPATAEPEPGVSSVADAPNSGITATNKYSPAAPAAIEIRGLSKSYGSNHVFTDYSASIPSGVTCLTGASGSGKTTLARILAGLEEGDAGTVSGVDHNVVFLFQEPRLLPWRTAAANVALAAPAGRSLRAGAGAAGDADSRPGALLRKLGLTEDDAAKRPGELSGGMRQRVSLARAALSGEALRNAGKRVSLTVLDEPLKGLDPASRAAAVNFIKTELCADGSPVLIITHSREDIDELGGSVLNIDGKTG
jgi:NitT/TauT family transport system permease protein